MSPEIPVVRLHERGSFKSLGEVMPADAPAYLSEPSNPSALVAEADHQLPTSGRRLAFAQWVTQPGSRAAATLARVTVNRWWHHHFGVGIVATPDNLGYSGAPPTHPELLEFLAGQLVESRWSAMSHSPSHPLFADLPAGEHAAGRRIQNRSSEFVALEIPVATPRRQRRFATPCWPSVETWIRRCSALHADKP